MSTLDEITDLRANDKMRALVFGYIFALGSTFSTNHDIIPGADITPGSAWISSKLPHQDNWGCNWPDFRHKVTIRSSLNERDDISDDLLWAFRKANHGGTVYLKPGQRYVIGKKLDLSFLDDVHLQLDGEILFTDDIAYWQANNFYYAFQKSITFWVWGGKKIRIYTNTGTGVLNGNGQAWYVPKARSLDFFALKLTEVGTMDLLAKRSWIRTTLTTVPSSSLSIMLPKSTSVVFTSSTRRVGQTFSSDPVTSPTTKSVLMQCPTTPPPCPRILMDGTR